MNNCNAKNRLHLLLHADCVRGRRLMRVIWCRFVFGPPMDTPRLQESLIQSDWFMQNVLCLNVCGRKFIISWSKVFDSFDWDLCNLDWSLNVPRGEKFDLIRTDFKVSCLIFFCSDLGFQIQLQSCSSFRIAVSNANLNELFNNPIKSDAINQRLRFRKYKVVTWRL